MQMLKLEIGLPCGCVVSQAVAESGDGAAAHLDKALPHQATILAYWFHQRITVQNRHRCELVSVGNPNGFTIRTDRHEKPSNPSLPQEGLPPSG